MNNNEWEPIYIPKKGSYFFLIEVGKFYKNRAGDKCYVYCASFYDSFYYAIPGEADTILVYKSENIIEDKDKKKIKYDLISEWSDE